MTAPLLRAGLVLASCGPLLAVWPGTASLYTLPKLLVLSLGAAVASAGALRDDDAEDRKAARSPGPGILGPIAAVLGALVLSTALSQNPPVSVLGEYSQHSHGLLPLALCAVIAALAQSAGLAAARGLLKAGAFAGAALSAYGLAQLAGLDPLLKLVGGLPEGRVVSLVGSPVSLGCCLAMLLPWQLGLALDGETPGKRRVGALSAALTVAGLWVTVSRGAWLAAAVGAGCYLFWTGRCAGSRLRLAVLGAAAAAAIAAAALTIPSWHARGTFESDAARLGVWKAAWRMSLAHPVSGVGPDAFQVMLGRFKGEDFVRSRGPTGSQVHAHNDFLEVLAVSGVLGLAAYLWLLLAAWRRLRGALRDDTARSPAAASGAALAAAFVFAKFNPVPLAGLALAAAALGTLDPRGARSRGIARASLLFSAVAVAASVWLLTADRSCLRAMRAQQAGRPQDALAAYAAATRLNPFELRYGLRRVGLLRELARSEDDPLRRRALLEEAVRASRVLVRWNPLEAEAQHALGGSLAALTLQGGADGMRESAEALERGLRADWSHRPLIETRLKLAALRGARDAAADSTRRLAELDALTPGR
ncbi:MAG TPA: hypothetical protein DD417_18210 [Elusimicrobia bacterium]|nr:hypothetical protein [Elusimicrobiota bacterium]